MSSTRRPEGAPAGPPPERKASGFAVTPQVLMVVYFLLLIIGVAVYWNMVVKASQDKLTAAAAREQQARTSAQTYQKKGEMLSRATALNTAIREKLKIISYRFMTDQSSVIPFWEQTFLPILFSSRINDGDERKIIPDEPYVFHVNMAMNPFNTLPPSTFFEDSDKQFPIAYEGEKNGQPIETPLDTRPPDFLTPYTFKLEKFRGTYQGLKQFIRDLQVRQNKTLFTVHCFTNAEDSNAGVYRTTTEWDIVLTVYFINPEAQASGDQPPAAPGSESC